MYSIAGRIIDFTDDPECMGNAEFLALIGGTEKYASCTGAERDYAVVLRGQDRHYRFPIFDKVATVLSSQYFNDRVEDLHPYIRVVAAYHIKKACQEFGVAVPEQVSRYSQVPQPFTSNVMYLEDMPDHQQVEIVKTAQQEVDAMVDFWNDNLRHMTPAERTEKATMLVNMPGAKLAALPKTVTDYAAKPHVGTLFKTALDQRARLVSRHDKAAALEYAEVLHAADEMAPADVAKLLGAADTKFKLAHLYGKIADPYLAVYGDLYKAAESAPENDDMGLRYKLETIAAESNGYKYHSILSESGAKEFVKDPLGAFKRLPKIVQDFLLADFEAHLRKNKEMPVNSYMSDTQIKKRTEEMRNGDYGSHSPEPYDPVAVKKERENAKYPKMVNEPVTKG